MATPVLIFGGLGAILAGWSMVDLLRARARLAAWTRIEGVVVGHRARRTVRKGRHRTMYHPLVEYPAGGTPRLHDSPVSSSSPRHDVGARVVILFDPMKPDVAVIDAFTVKYFVPLVLGGIGVVFIAVASWLSTQPP